MSVIEVRDLRKTYGSTVAVDRLSLDVADGEVVGVLGPNGSGKTTTVECIAGLRRPDAGSVRVDGLDPVADRRAVTTFVGVQLQQAGLQAKLTAREALELYASFYDEPADGLALAERLGIGDKLGTRYDNLSGGQKQRLAVALALIGRPRVALLDELTTGLDPRSRRGVWEVVEEARADGTTIILVTHFMEEAQHLCDRLVLISEGRIVAEGTPREIIGQTGAPTTMSFTPSSPVPHEVFAAIDGVSDVRSREGDRVELNLTDSAVLEVLEHLRTRGVRPNRLRVEDSTLDDAFLDLTAEPANIDSLDHTEAEVS
ncbi:ABC transporter ATP-binding protein [Aeromicrobium sp. CTD01-1L150]|uniref:ABC transporter ATP-binding protein n=1 Tax=Aeromicrobium sp. CTD01-1L150 TaxID=3341830 RepID=UPI0035C2066E